MSSATPPKIEKWTLTFLETTPAWVTIPLVIAILMVGTLVGYFLLGLSLLGHFLSTGHRHFAHLDCQEFAWPVTTCLTCFKIFD